MTTLRDIYYNIKFAIYRCSIEVRDPFARMEVEKKLKELGIEYLTGYTSFLGLYSYGIIGVPGVRGGLKKKYARIDEFLDWFKEGDKLRCFQAKNELFKTPMYGFYRDSENIDISALAIK